MPKKDINRRASFLKMMNLTKLFCSDAFCFDKNENKILVIKISCLVLFSHTKNMVLSSLFFRIIRLLFVPYVSMCFRFVYIMVYFRKVSVMKYLFTIILTNLKTFVMNYKFIIYSEEELTSKWLWLFYSLHIENLFRN